VIFFYYIERQCRGRSPNWNVLARGLSQRKKSGTGKWRCV